MHINYYSFWTIRSTGILVGTELLQLLCGKIHSLDGGGSQNGGGGSFQGAQTNTEGSTSYFISI